MTKTHRIKRVEVTAVRVHPFYYRTVYDRKRRLQHFLNQLCRVISMLSFGACFVQFALMAPQIPAIVHLSVLALLLAVIIMIGNQIRQYAAARAKFKRFEKLKKTSVIYIHNQKVRSADDHKN